jgi:hypothetical protein
MRATKRIWLWFLRGFVIALGAAAAGWLLAYIPPVRVMGGQFFSLVTGSPKAVLTTSASLFLLGFLCLLIAYYRYLRLKKKHEIPPEPPSIAGTPAAIPPQLPKSPGSWDEAAVRSAVVGKPQFTPRHLRPEDMRMHR